MLLSANLDTDVGDSTFADCTSLRDVTFGAGCHIIGSNAFSSCVGIRSLSLGADVEQIGSLAFSGAQSITKAESMDTIKYWSARYTFEKDWNENSNIGAVQAACLSHIATGPRNIAA